MDYLDRAEAYARKLAGSPERRFTHLTPGIRGLAIAFDEEVAKLRKEMTELRNALHAQKTRGEAE